MRRAARRRVLAGALCALAGAGAAHADAARAVGPEAAHLLRALACAGCHPGLPVAAPAPGETGAPDLDDAGLRLGAARLLAALERHRPARGEPAAARMPDFGLAGEARVSLALFLDTRRRALDPEAGAVARAASGAEPASEDRRAREEAWARARARFPRAGVAQGEAIFRGQRCAACHRLSGAPARRDAPDLAAEGARVRREWLEAYLTSPSVVRPAGAPPGSGARMPDFGLAPDEVSLLADALLALGAERRPAAPPDWNRPLSAHGRAVAERLLREKLDCLGCHRLGAEGGRIGPDLTGAGRRLQPAFVRALLADPGAWPAGRWMPGRHWPAARLDLVARFLAQDETPAAPTAPLALPARGAPAASHAVADSGASGGPDRGARLYGEHCAACHGATGGGDGWNAGTLPVPPTRHADAGAMRRRSDAALFDGIHGGGAVLGRSPRMPAWGARLTGDEIRDLVAHIRVLCRCEGPAWSRDGAAGGD